MKKLLLALLLSTSTAYAFNTKFVLVFYELGATKPTVSPVVLDTKVLCEKEAKAVLTRDKKGLEYICSPVMVK